MYRALLLLALACGPAAAQDIDLANRVGNVGPGVCWWACADMVGRQYGIGPLIGIRDRVVETGVGRDRGARQEDIDHWVRELGLSPDATFGPGKDTAFLTGTLARGLPVITSMFDWGDSGGQHAVLVVRITEEERDWDNGRGRKGRDRIVYYVDPNDEKELYWRTWTSFVDRWSGRAYAFDPAKHASLLVRKPLRPGRLLQAAGGFVPEAALPPAPVLQAVPRASAPSGPVRQKSNQDIKDGVNRPDDLFRIPLYLPD